MEIRTLLLEDDGNTRSLLETILTERGHRVFSYASPLLCPLYKEPDCRCEKTSPCVDFLLTDNQMPGMSGLQFIQLQAERGCKISVNNKAIFSGDWRYEDIKIAQSLGYRTFAKPFNLAEFNHWLDIGEQRLKTRQNRSCGRSDSGTGC